MSDLQGKMDTTEEPEYLEEATAVQLLDEISDVLRWGVCLLILFPSH